MLQTANQQANGSGTAAALASDRSPEFDIALQSLGAVVTSAVTAEGGDSLARGEVARVIGKVVSTYLNEQNVHLDLIERRDLVAALLAAYSAGAEERKATQVVAAPPPAPGATLANTRAEPLPVAAAQRMADAANSATRATIEAARARLQPLLMARIDISEAAKLNRLELEAQIGELIPELLIETRLQLNAAEQRSVIETLLDEMLGLGPLEPLLADEGVTDIMVNGPKQIYIEKRGKLTLTDIQFRDNAHVMNVATRIVSRIGRRVDETQPLVDARLLDGSRVNIIIPPLAIDGPSISIRKFSKKSITLDIMGRQGNISPQMAGVLKIAGRCRLNIIISGGTGSGKTTLLNALSQMIDPGERVVTIEDAAELQLQQPHVVRLETRPPNIEGKGEISMRELVKNALRMRPDRIILGECRGGEAMDMLQAMNTGHEGSMSTIHANRPREALTRLENMIGMAAVNLPSRAVRQQIASAVNMIVQVQRMRDGIRRVTHVVEIVGMEGDVITTQDLFTFEFTGEGPDGKLQGVYRASGLRPAFLPKAEYFGLGKALLEAV